MVRKSYMNQMLGLFFSFRKRSTKIKYFIINRDDRKVGVIRLSNVAKKKVRSPFPSLHSIFL